MAAPALSNYDSTSLYDNIVRLHGVSWADYERLLEMRGDSSAPRYTYWEGELEIMSPSKTHESIKSMIGRLIEVWCLDNDIEFSTLGAWLLQDRARKLGVEPDECYVFGSNADATIPQLAIEVEWAHGGVDKLRVYEQLGVAELWVWCRGRIQIHELFESSYRAVEQSQALHGIDLRVIERLIESPTTSQAIREFRATLKR